jgi:Co/Zn/Cd efflux system component
MLTDYTANIVSEAVQKVLEQNVGVIIMAGVAMLFLGFYILGDVIRFLKSMKRTRLIASIIIIFLIIFSVLYINTKTIELLTAAKSEILILKHNNKEMSVYMESVESQVDSLIDSSINEAELRGDLEAELIESKGHLKAVTINIRKGRKLDTCGEAMKYLRNQEWKK